GARQALADRTAERDQARGQIDAHRVRLADLRAHGSGLASRIEVLERLERSREGYGAGIRDVFELLSAQAHVWQPVGLTECVVGLVGDLLTAPRDVAHLLDIALGSAAQNFLVRGEDRLALALADLSKPLSGRVSFLPLRPAPVEDAFADEPAVRRADRLV